MNGFIRADQFQAGADRLQLAEQVPAVFAAGTALEFRKEIMAPLRTLNRTAVQTAHIEAVRSDDVQDFGEGARFVAHRENDAEMLAGGGNRR